MRDYGPAQHLQQLLMEAGRERTEMQAQRDHWIRLFNRLEGAVAHHRRAASEMFGAGDERLWAAHKSILKAAANRHGAEYEGYTEQRARDVLEWLRGLQADGYDAEEFFEAAVREFGNPDDVPLRDPR